MTHVWSRTDFSGSQTVTGEPDLGPRAAALPPVWGAVGRGTDELVPHPQAAPVVTAHPSSQGSVEARWLLAGQESPLPGVSMSPLGVHLSCRVSSSEFGDMSHPVSDRGAEGREALGRTQRCLDSTMVGSLCQGLSQGWG